MIICLHSSVALQGRHSFPTRRSSDLSSRDHLRIKMGSIGPTIVVAIPLRTNPAKSRMSRLRCPCAPICSSCSSQDLFRSEEHTSELQSHHDLVCRLLLEKKNNTSLLV